MKINGDTYPRFYLLYTNQGGTLMADVSSTVENVVGGIVSLIKGLIVLFVFANIVYDTGFDPVYGIINLVDSFLSGGFAGLLALLVLVSFL